MSIATQATRILGSVFRKKYEPLSDVENMRRQLVYHDKLRALRRSDGWEALTSRLAVIVAEKAEKIIHMAEAPDKNREELIRAAAYIEAIKTIVGVVDDAEATGPSLAREFEAKVILTQRTISNARGRTPLVFGSGSLSDSKENL